MSKKLLLILFAAMGVVWPACTTLTIPTDYLTVDAFRRANQAANWTATREAHNDCKDSLNETRTRIVNWTSNLALKSLQDLALKMDDDNNGTHKIAFLNGSADTLGKVTEDTTWRFYRHGVFDSNLTVGKKLVVADSVRLTQLTASLPVVTTANKQLASATVTGTGTTLVMSASPTGTGTWTLPNVNMTGDLVISRASSGGAVIAYLDNSSNTTNSSTVFNSRVAGASAGDPVYQATVDGVRTWTWGIDNDASDAFVLAASGSLGTSNVLSAAVGGALTVTPALNVTGKATFTDSIVGVNQRLIGNLSLARLTAYDTIFGGNQQLTGTLNAAGTVTADSLISSKFYAEGTATVTLTGCTTAPTGTARWVRVGKMVTLNIPALTATSNSSDATYTGLPAGLAPTNTAGGYMVLQDNSTNTVGAWFFLAGSATLNFATLPGGNAGFTSSGTKGVQGAVSVITYTLQ